jgi:hypothetical protein
MRVTVARTRSVLAAWDTRTHRLWLLWEVADIVVAIPDPKQGSDDLKLVIMKKAAMCRCRSYHSRISFILCLTGSVRARRAAAQSGASESKSEQFHDFDRTFQPNKAFLLGMRQKAAIVWII